MNTRVPTATIEQICSCRDEAIRLFDDDSEKIEVAAGEVAAAGRMWEAASTGDSGSWSNRAEENEAASSSRMGVFGANLDMFALCAFKIA